MASKRIIDIRCILVQVARRCGHDFRRRCAYAEETWVEETGAQLLVNRSKEFVVPTEYQIR